MKTSISDYESFRFVCKKASEEENVFNNFKTHVDFISIMEHTNREQGEGYVNYIKNSHAFVDDMVHKIKINDKLGGPVLENFDELFNNISNSTLRYLKVAIELKELFGDLSEKTIIEIGGGYGGQCLILQTLFPNLKYTIVDLPEVCNLSKKYLTSNNINNVTVLTVDDIHAPIESDLVISNYAISECNKVVQNIYIDNILKYSERGYITYNHISHLFDIDSYSPSEFKEILNCKEKSEVPSTGPNIIYYW